MQISLRNPRKLDCAGKAAQRPTLPHPAVESSSGKSPSLRRLRAKLSEHPQFFWRPALDSAEIERLSEDGRAGSLHKVRFWAGVAKLFSKSGLCSVLCRLPTATQAAQMRECTVRRVRGPRSLRTEFFVFSSHSGEGRGTFHKTVHGFEYYRNWIGPSHGNVTNKKDRREAHA
jgi:hypothetical protein